MGVGSVATKKVVIEVEVPRGVDEKVFLREAERQLARISLLMTLENLQKRVPSQEEVEELSREIKRKAYRDLG